MPYKMSRYWNNAFCFSESFCVSILLSLRLTYYYHLCLSLFSYYLFQSVLSLLFFLFQFYHFVSILSISIFSFVYRFLDHTRSLSLSVCVIFIMYLSLFTVSLSYYLVLFLCVCFILCNSLLWLLLPRPLFPSMSVFLSLFMFVISAFFLISLSFISLSFSYTLHLFSISLSVGYFCIYFSSIEVVVAVVAVADEEAINMIKQSDNFQSGLSSSNFLHYSINQILLLQIGKIIVVQKT